MPIKLLSPSSHLKHKQGKKHITFKCNYKLDRENRRIMRTSAMCKDTVVKLYEDMFYADEKVRRKDAQMLQNGGI